MTFKLEFHNSRSDNTFIHTILGGYFSKDKDFTVNQVADLYRNMIVELQQELDTITSETFQVQHRLRPV